MSFAGIAVAALSRVLIRGGDALCVCDAKASAAAAFDSAAVTEVESRVDD